MPSSKVRMEELLERYHISKQALIVLPCSEETHKRVLTTLATWLLEHPDARVILVCPRFDSARRRTMLQKYIPPQVLTRLRLRTVHDADYDETNWWKYKTGLMDTLNNFLSYAYIRINGPTEVEMPPWDRIQYEKSLRSAPAVGLANPAPNPLPTKLRRWHWKRWLVIVVAVSLLWLWRTTIFLAMGHYLDISEPPVQTDYVLVLGGDHNFRPAVAAALFKAGLVKDSILIPTLRQSESEKANGFVSPHDLVRTVLVKCGVKESAVHLLPGEVDSTADEARSLGRFLDSHPGSSITIVTTDFHTRRARWLFQRNLGDRASKFHYVAAPTEGFSADNWWMSDNGFVIYLNEYAKLVLYCFKS